MRFWLRGKRGGLIGFLGVAALVLGGLGWVTAAVLDLEAEQRKARAEADLMERLRLALWQLDGFILPDLAREDARPFHHYGRSLSAAADIPDWILLHFQCDATGWKSPELLPPSGKKQPGVPGEGAAAALARRRERVLQDLRGGWDARSLLALIQDHGPPPFITEPAQVQANSLPFNSSQSGDNDYNKRLNSQARVKQEVSKANRPEPVAVSISRQMVPLWLSDDGRPARLVLVRDVRLGDRQVCQGLVIDWPGLQSVLAEQVRELFPDARFLPVRARIPPRLERTLTALPVELDPGTAAALPPVGWTPLRIGLLIAWSAVLVGVVAVGLGGWSLLDLSERRSRFVSAVTHELRTPLTTLRLYLDMLTSGLVQGEAQRAEYLHTLHAEADRLNRLIANVLDFSCLEKQQPRLEKTRVAVADLLEQVRSAWQTRCAAAGKELVVENGAGPGAGLVTDARLVEQVLGNLIDNACKYSGTAADRRLWVRSRIENRRLMMGVEDHGPGIPARERRAVFRPFRRGRQADVAAGGVGLGLALARRWAKLLGGRLTLQCGRDHPGACFCFDLPYE
jgi:signal transduction histidine kinase